MFINNVKKYTFCHFIILLFFALEVSFLYAVPQKTLEEMIAEKAAFKRQNPHIAISTSDIASNYDVNSVVAQAINLTKDPNSPDVRGFGYQLLTTAARGHDDLKLRQTAVNALVDGLADKEASLSSFCVEQLKNYSKKDFAEEAKGKLKHAFDEMLQKNIYNNHTRDIILLLGVADIQSAMGQLQATADQIDKPLRPFEMYAPPLHEIAFAALEAKARMGDPNAVQRCIALVDAEMDGDINVRFLFKQIAYIRQPKAVDYIKQYLCSDKKEHYTGPDVLQQPYSRIAAEDMEEMIVGFPTHKEISDFYLKKYGSADLDFRKKWPNFDDYYGYHCRQWLEAQTSIEIIR